MRRRLACLAAALLALSTLAARAAGDEARVEVEAGASHENLTQGLPRWSSRYLLLERRAADRQVLYGGWRDTERYDLKDSEVHAGAYLPLAPWAQFQAEAGYSDSHRVLARRYGVLGLHLAPGSGWGLSAGWRRSEYDSGYTGVLSAGVERYVANERFAYTVFSGGPDGTGSSPSHRLQWNHYYGERDWIGLALASGRETEYAAGRFITSRIDAINLAGRHEILRDWAVSWELGSQRQGDLYTRSGLRLGLRHGF